MLEVRRVEKIIENKSRLYIEKLEFQSGEIVAIIGSAGSGKSLFLYLLSGTLIPSGGEILLKGKDIYRHPELRFQIGLMPEEDLLYERLTARQNLTFFQQLYQVPASRIEEVLTLIRLNDLADRPLRKLSSSVQRRLAFARTLLLRPSLYLLDQPVLRADHDTQNLILEQVTRVASEGACVLLTGEDMSWMGKCATHIVELHAGRIVAQSTIKRNAKEEENDQQGEIITGQIFPTKISARRDDRIVFFDDSEILYATSRDGKTILRSLKEEATSNLTLQELEQKLAGRGFFKAHRAYLVNLQHIKAIIQYTRNSYTLVLKDEEETMIPLSKQSERALSELMGY